MSTEKMFLKDARFGDFLGIDILMDQDLKIWILESNRNPNLEAAGEENRIFAVGFCENILFLLHEH